MILGAFLIIRALRRNGVSGAGFFLCAVCLCPAGLEATYWLAAATRVTYALLFIGAALSALTYWYETDKLRGLILFGVFGMICVGFYEPAIVIYIILTLFTVWNNRNGKKVLAPLLILAAQICAIGIYYAANAGAGEIQSRGGFVETNYAEHFTVVFDYIKTIFSEYIPSITKRSGYVGLLTITGGHAVIKTGIVAAVSLMFGLAAALCVKKRKFSPMILLLGVALFAGGLVLNFILGSERIPLRLVYFSFLGIGLIADELLTLLPYRANRILTAVLLSVLAFGFTTAGIGEAISYKHTSEYDAYITEQLVELDTPERISDPDRNTYLFGGQHYYVDNASINYLDHIRGVSGNYADITGCMRHITGVPFTNNIMTFTYGDTQALKPYIDVEGLCTFYNVEYDKTVSRVSLAADGDNYNIVREDGTVAGMLKKIDDVSYMYLN